MLASRYNSTPPTFKDGDLSEIQTTVEGQLKMQLWSDNSTNVATRFDGSSDGNGVGGFRLGVAGLNMLFNGTTYDRERANIDTAALVTATGATTTQTGADQTNYNGRGVKVVLDMTVVGTGSVTLTIQGKDVASGKYYTLLAGAAVTTISTNVYEIGPGLPATANVSANAQLPRTWRVLVTANNANATTYTVGASVIR